MGDEATSPEAVPDSTDSATDEEDTTSNDNTENSTAKSNAQQKRAEYFGKIEQGIDKMNQAVGKTHKVVLEPKVAQYEAALAKLINNAQADGTVDAAEQAKIDALTNQLADLKQNLEDKGRLLTPEREQKASANLSKATATLDQLLNSLS